MIIHVMMVRISSRSYNSFEAEYLSHSRDEETDECKRFGVRFACVMAPIDGLSAKNRLVGQKWQTKYKIDAYFGIVTFDTLGLRILSRSRRGKRRTQTLLTRQVRAVDRERN